MGREAVCTASWNGTTAEAKALLEASGIILRGAIKAQIARDTIGAVSVAGDALTVDVAGAPLRLVLGAAEATKWQTALSKPLPTLAEKLGLAGGKRAFVLGDADDAALAQVLDGVRVAMVGGADLIVAIVRDTADLAAAFEAARSAALPAWIVIGKGGHATVPDMTVRSFMRERGWIDTKTSAISDRWTATRYSAR